jgi:capsular exopolysaccharide synthesis family protein
MSQLFDALQRSEAERSGGKFPSSSLATEVLQAAEREATAGRETTVVCDLPVQAEVLGEQEVFPDFQAAAALGMLAQAQTAAEIAANDIGDPFSKFQSLPIVLPAQSRLVCLTEKDSLASEKFRFLGVRLRQLRQNRQLKKVLITSAIPQEGKSMVAANLACTLARRTQQRTILLEGDLRRPSLSQMFGLGKLQGLSEWLQGERGPATSIYHLEGPGFWFLPAGSSPRNALELMQSGRLSAIMDQLAAWFDWIVIDSPPVLPLADTSLWVRLADGILLVTRQGTTEKKQLQRGLEAIEPQKLIGALLNCSSGTAHSNYYYHYPLPSSQPDDKATE